MRRRFAAFLLIGFSFVAFIVSAEQLSSKVAVATAHPLATRAGIEILEKGGNAFDAAVAITAALAVVEPYSSGLGGGAFWLFYLAGKDHYVMIDGRETAPSSATPDMYQDESGKVIQGLSLNGPLAAGIPGVPAGIDHINHRYGRLGLAKNLAPAIRYAGEGFAVGETYRLLAGFRLDVLRQSPAAADVFLENNDIPGEGFILKQPELAETLKIIARQGAAGFYSGPIADRLVEGTRKAGGIWTQQDLLDYHVVEREPIRTRYHDMRMISASPPSSGGIVLGQALNILENFDLNRLDNITRKHVIVEAMRRAYRDRAAYLGDTDFVDVPIKRLLNKDYAEGLASGIHLDRATSSDELAGVLDVAGKGRHTTHFSVLDTEGNRVSATLSINYPFGSGFMPPGTGVVLNDEMDDFAVKPLTPNAYGLVGDEANRIAPGKRPLSSMSPTFIETDDKIAILGTPGGSRIISMVLLGILDFADGKLPKSWVSLPRYHHQYLPDEIQHEKNGLTAHEIHGLQRLGHTVTEKNRQYGDMQAILWYKPRNLVFAASDPRGEGEATVSSIRSGE